MITIAHTGTSSDNMKHIAPAINSIHEAITNGTFKLTHVDSKNNLADLFTKPLPIDHFIRLRDSLGMSDAT
jgi:hypothetical protein